MADELVDQHVLDYFESDMKKFIVERLSNTKNWWDSCIPPEIRRDASERHADAKKINDILNKPDYGPVDYLNFDSYGKIILRRDNWRNYFESIFVDKMILEYKMRIIQSLRNDIRHGRKVDAVNSIRLRLHCYDIISQIHETGQFDDDQRVSLAKKLGLIIH